MNCQKDLFSLPDTFHYLNCSYMSPLLKKVEEAGIQGIQSKRRPWETHPDNFFEDSETLRTLFARVIHAESNDVAILPSVSYGMATVAKNINIKSGQNIIVAGEQFPSNIYPWHSLAQQTGCSVVTVHPPSESKNRAKNWNSRILENINRDTALVALSHVHWTDGSLFDLVKISEAAHHEGALFVIDGTQSVGALPFDINEIKPDALICAGYKWLMGPYSMALGYFGSYFENRTPLEEGWIVRAESEDFSQLIHYQDDYQPGAIRYDVGERSNFILVPMMIEALKQILDWGVPSISDYISSLNRELIDLLAEYPFQFEDEQWRAPHILGIRLPDSIPMDEPKKAALRVNDISVSIRGNAVRVSPHVYNDSSDIQALAKVFKGLTTKSR